jgi:hypothetical protein
MIFVFRMGSRVECGISMLTQSGGLAKKRKGNAEIFNHGWKRTYKDEEKRKGRKAQAWKFWPLFSNILRPNRPGAF